MKLLPAFLFFLTPFLMVSHGNEAPSLFTGDPIVISEGHQFAEGMAFDGDGNFYFTDVPAGKLYKVDSSGEKTLFDGESGKTNGIAIGPDGMLYGCAGGDKRIYQWDLKTGKKSPIAEGPHSNDIAITKNGTIFFSDPAGQAVWRISPAPERKLEKAAALAWKPNGIALNPRKDVLFVAEFFAGTVHRLAVGKDGELSAPEPAYRPAVGPEGKGFLDGMIVLPSGNLLIGTASGIQIVPPIAGITRRFDHVVVPPFGDRPRCNYVRLSPDGKWLYTAFRKDILKIPVREGAIQ
jgi:gluconolactonase